MGGPWLAPRTARRHLDPIRDYLGKARSRSHDSTRERLLLWRHDLGPDFGGPHPTTPNAHSTFVIKLGWVWGLESVLVLAQLERLFAAFHHMSYLVANTRHIYRTLQLQLPAGLVSSSPIITDDYQFRVTVDNEIRVVTSEDHLSLGFGFPHPRDDILDDLAV